MKPPVNKYHVSVPPIPWRPLGQVRTAPTNPVIGGARRVCPGATTRPKRGTSWQHYRAPCSNYT
jgi:hypothetical protein